jgi:hypothetical protein
MTRLTKTLIGQTMQFVQEKREKMGIFPRVLAGSCDLNYFIAGCCGFNRYRASKRFNVER